MARLYARVVGPTVILIGIVGLLLGNRPIGGALNIDLIEDAIHLSTGGLLTVLGFSRIDDGVVRNAVGGLGVVYHRVDLSGRGAGQTWARPLPTAPCRVDQPKG